MVKYRVRTDCLKDPEGHKYRTYGLDVIETERNGGKGETLLRSVPNIFLTRTDAQALAERCNRLRVSPTHLIDVIEDTLS